jgi:hypothetical protein
MNGIPFTTIGVLSTSTKDFHLDGLMLLPSSFDNVINQDGDFVLNWFYNTLKPI